MSVQELHRTIEKLQRKLVKYENKLRDVIAAYKSLLAEKDSLEASLQALTENSNENEEKASTSSATSKTIDSIAALKHTIQTLTTESNRRDAAYAEEKRQLLEERRLLRHELRTLRDEYENQRTMYDSHLSEAQEMLRQKQRTHEKELNELNAKMAELITKSAKAKAGQSQPTTECFDPSHSVLESRVHELEAQVSENAQNSSSEMTRLLMSKLNDAKVEHERSMDAQRRRVLQLEQQLSEMTLWRQSEAVEGCRQCVELQESLAMLQKELSDKDSRLHESSTRIVALEMENESLLSTVHNDIATSKSTNEEAPHDREYFVTHMRSCTKALREEFAMTDAQLLETLNIRMHNAEPPLSPLTNALEDTHLRRDLSRARDQLHTMHQKLTVAESELTKANERIKDMQQEHEKQTKATAERHREEMLQEQHQHKNAIEQLQSELAQQRERSMHVIDEMQAELRAMRSVAMHHSAQRTSSTREAILGRSESLTPTDPQPATVSAHSPGSVHSVETNHETHSLYEAIELTRREREVVTLRREIRQLEGQLRDTQHELVTVQLQQHSTTEHLKAEIKALEARIECNENDNDTVQYLRNVLLQFLKCSDVQDRKHMLKAIGQVLHFTPAEMKGIDAAATTASATTPTSSTGLLSFFGGK